MTRHSIDDFPDDDLARCLGSNMVETSMFRRNKGLSHEDSAHIIVARLHHARGVISEELSGHRGLNDQGMLSKISDLKAEIERLRSLLESQMRCIDLLRTDLGSERDLHGKTVDVCIKEKKRLRAEVERLRARKQTGDDIILDLLSWFDADDPRGVRHGATERAEAFLAAEQGVK